MTRFSNIRRNMHQNAQFCNRNFTNFPRALPRTPMLGRGYGAPPQTLPPQRSALHASHASIGAFGPSIVRPGIEKSKVGNPKLSI